MAKDFGGWLGKSQATYGDKSGGGSKGKASSAPKAAMGKKNGGVGGPTPYGESSGGGKGPKGGGKAVMSAKGIKTWKR